MKTANFDVTEIWTVECPHDECYHEQDAPFNESNPMEPMEVECEKCGEKFILTYERD
jgi:hypothetical protein